MGTEPSLYKSQQSRLWSGGARTGSGVFRTWSIRMPRQSWWSCMVLGQRCLVCLLFVIIKALLYCMLILVRIRGVVEWKIKITCMCNHFKTCIIFSLCQYRCPLQFNCLVLWFLNQVLEHCFYHIKMPDIFKDTYTCFCMCVFICFCIWSCYNVSYYVLN